MPAVNTPICEFGWQAKNFSLPSTDNEIIELKKARGRKGTPVSYTHLTLPTKCSV